MRREPFSRVISLGTEDTKTSETLWSGTVAPLARCTRRLRIASRFRLTSGTPQTTNVEEPLLFVELPHLRALDERRDRVPYRPRREAEERPAIGAKPNLDLRHEHLSLDLEVHDPFDVRDRGAYRLGLRLESSQVRPVDPYHDRGARPGQDLLDALAEVRQEIPIEPGIRVDDRLDPRHGRLVVDRRVETDPELGEVWTDDFVRDFRAADVGAEVYAPREPREAPPRRARSRASSLPGRCPASPPSA